MRNVASLGIRSLRERGARSWFAGISVVLAVTVVFGVYAGTSSLSRDMAELQDDISVWAGVVAVPVGAEGVTLTDDTKTAVAQRSGVASVAGGYEFGGTVGVVTGPHAIDEPTATIGTVLIAGLEAPALQRAATLVEGRWPGPGEVVLGARTARELGTGMRVGDTVRVQGSAGPRAAVVVGFADGGLAGLFGGYTALGDLSWVREIDRGAGFRRLFVSLEPGVAPQEWIDDNTSALPGVELTAADDDSNTPADFLNGFSPILQSFSLLGVLIGGYVIYLTFSTAVVERRATYGLLRALGAEPRQVLAAVVAEAAVLGVAGTVVGLVAGTWIAQVVIRELAALGGAAPGDLEVTATSVLVAVAVGVLAPVISVLGPARRASRTDPSVVMRGEPTAGLARKTRWPVAAALFLGGVAAIRSDNNGLSGLGLAIVLTAAALTLPMVLVPAARLLQPVIRRILPGLGDVAVHHLVREHSRSAYTAGLVMIVLAVTVAMATAYSSLRVPFDAALESWLGADLEIRTYDGPLDPLVLQTVDEMPTRARSEAATGTTTLVDPSGGRESLLALDPATYFDVAGISWVQGPGTEAVRERLAAGGTVVLPEIYADELSVAPGDQIVLATTAGDRPFEVVATYAAIGTGGLRSIVVSMDDGRAHFGVTNAHALYVDLQEREDPSRFQSQLDDELAPIEGTYYVQDNSEIRPFVRSQFDSFAAMFNGILGIVAIVGVLGLANTLVVAVLARIREAGLLRAVGVHRRELAWLTAAEATTLTLTGLLLAAPLGAWLGWLITRGFTDGLGVQMHFRYPWYAIPTALALALLFAALASILPARRATRLDPVAALRFE